MNIKRMVLHAVLPALLVGVFAINASQASAASRKKQKTQPIRVACVGNSITYGTGIEDRAHDSYPSQLQRMLGDKYVVGNFGKPGATLLYHGHRPYVVQKEFKEALAFKGDIAVIHLGINDTDPRNWPNYRDEFVKDYLSIMDSLRVANPKVRFILARMTPIADRHPRFISGTKLWHGEIQSAIETVARLSGAELIDFHEPLYPYPNLLPDAIHPNPEGAGILAKTMYSGITGNYGGLQMSQLYTDYMVLQRNVQVVRRAEADGGCRRPYTYRQGWQTDQCLPSCGSRRGVALLGPVEHGVHAVPGRELQARHQQRQRPPAPSLRHEGTLGNVRRGMARLVS